MIPEKYALYSSWIVRIFTAILLISFLLYLMEIIIDSSFSQDISRQWLMDTDEYNAIDTTLIPLTDSLVRLAIILFSSTFICTLSILFFLYLRRKEYYYSAITLLIVIIQSIAAVNSLL